MEIRSNLVSSHLTKIVVGMEMSESGSDVVGTVELDIENQSRFVDAINVIYEESKDGMNIIVDMQNITYIDSSGLWALFEGHKKALQHNAKMVLLSPTKDVKRVLDITKMSGKLEIFDDEKDAVSRLSVVS